MEKLRSSGIDPYPAKYSKSFISINEAREQMDQTVNVVGRIWAWREHGNVIFADLKDESGKIQLLFQKKSLEDKWKTLKLLDAGDFLGVEGKVTTTSAGETTIDVSEFELLTKALRPLPDDWFGLKDEEARYRQRYVDLMLNPELKDLFKKKALFWQSMRNFLVEKGFAEVETPVLETTAGGADANPFVTHHNALDIDLYLRISMGELWQKRLMVAGFEKTFEIGRQFRNEGLSREHLQDYSQMEFYWAYANYLDSMKLVEEMYKYVAQKTFGTLQFTIGQFEVDLGKTWEKIDYSKTILEHTKIDLSHTSEVELKAKLKSLNVAFGENDDRGRLVDLLWKTVRKNIAGPVFLTGHPVEVSPLAKRMPERPEFVERYQVILAGSEMGNGYSELNDPIDQAERFAKQQEMREHGDDEAQMFDHDFVKALEYGMPPVSGFGVSERLFSFLANLPVREAVLFPLLRPEEQAGHAKQDFDQKLVIVIDPELPSWKIMNTSAHAAAFLGNKMKSAFDTGKFFATKDGTNLPRNSQYPIVTLSATKDQLKELAVEVRASGLLYLGYVPEMMDTTDDKKLAEMLASKSDDEIVYAGIGIFGPKSEVDKLTKKFSLWK
jgi:lysyl-tRNA synthetase class 2